MFDRTNFAFRGFLVLCAGLIFGNVALARKKCTPPVCTDCAECCMTEEDWCPPCVPGVNCPGEGGCALIPPIPPAPDPPIADDRTFVRIVNPNPIQDCTPPSNPPEEAGYSIRVDRYVGEVDNNGRPVDLNAMIQAGRIGLRARLTIMAWDVDSRTAGACGRGSERAQAYFNRHPLGPLWGHNRSWQTIRYNIPISWVKFPKKGTGNSGPIVNRNKLVIESDTKCGCWCHHIGWIALEIGATSPVFMLHGAGQSNTFWDPPKPGEVGGGATIDDALRSEYFVVNTDLDQADKTVDEAAVLIEANIKVLVHNLGVDSIHLVAHSKGGADAITYLDKFCAPKGFCPGDFQVLSLTTLGTPFAGSSGTDIAFARAQGLFAIMINFPETFVTETLSLLLGGGPSNMTVAKITEQTNDIVLRLGDTNTVFNTIGSDADDDGNGHLSRPEAAPGLAFFNLTGFFDLLATIGGHLVADVIYHNLSLVESVTYTRVFNGLWVIIVANRTDTPQGNDIFVTFNSAFGPQSFRDLVDRPDRAGFRKLYDGAKGRTHFDIADFAVGSDPDDEDVAEWLADIERRFGDIRFRNVYRLPLP